MADCWNRRYHKEVKGDEAPQTYEQFMAYVQEAGGRLWEQHIRDSRMGEIFQVSMSVFSLHPEKGEQISYDARPKRRG